MTDQIVLRRVLERGKAEEAGMVAVAAQGLRFAECLGGESADAADAHKGNLPASIRDVHFLRADFQDRLKQLEVCVADCELRSMHPDCEPSGAGGDVIAEQRTLPALVEMALFGQREGAGG